MIGHIEVETWTAEEEKEIAKRAKAGDKEAKDRLITSYIPLAIKIAHQYNFTGVDCEDRCQDAAVGLLQAFNSYDPDKGRFGTWARHYIRGNLYRTTIDPDRADVYGRNDTTILDDYNGFDDCMKDSIEDVHSEDEQHIIEFMSVLDDKELEIVQMRLEGKSQKEIGDRYGVTAVAAGLWLKKIKEKLQAAIDN